MTIFAHVLQKTIYNFQMTSISCIMLLFRLHHYLVLVESIVNFNGILQRVYKKSLQQIRNIEKKINVKESKINWNV